MAVRGASLRQATLAVSLSVEHLREINCALAFHERKSLVEESA